MEGTHDAQSESQSPHGTTGSVEMPRPTAWPMVLAFGATLMASGLLLNLAFSAVGLVVFVIALGGWIHQLMPGVGEYEEAWVPADQRPRPIREVAASVEALRAGMPGHRMRLPIEVHPYSAGLKGGIVGGLAMAVMAAIYGLRSGNGLWYPVNLLAGIVMPSLQDATAEQLREFHAGALVVGLVLHAVMSLGVGLFYGMILPTLPRWPVLWGGIVGPLMWTGAIWVFMAVLNPVLNEHVDWPWFIASQFAFGLTAGIVIVMTAKVPTRQRKLPLTESDSTNP